ncbi:MAG: hypothetical protein ACO4BJ_02370 [Planctomycetota bacterium]|jgi:hypothetical protein
MSLFRKLFSTSAEPDLESLRGTLGEVERERRRSRVGIRRWERQRRQLVDRMKRSREEGNPLEVDYLWEQFKQHRSEGVDLRREGRLHNLEALALGRTIRALERLEQKRNRDGARSLLDRLRASGLMERALLDRDEQLRRLEEWDEVLEQFESGDEERKSDPEKALFLAELDSISEVERAGEADEARTREDELLRRFEAEPER